MSKQDCIVVHSGRTAPHVPDPMSPDDVAPFWVIWEDFDEALLSDEWVVPAGFTVVATQSNQAVTIDDVEYTKVNSIMVTTTHTKGRFQFSNKQKFVGSSVEITKSFTFNVSSKV